MNAFLCRLDDVPDGASRGFDPHGLGRDELFVVRRAGAVYAWQDSCPHIEGAAMAWRKDAYLSADRTRIVCHAHGAQFDIVTGACLCGPCEGQALKPVAVNINPDGELWLARDIV
jgi:nitrite reductase/ring-hydroxylating ferredoxin subunit